MFNFRGNRQKLNTGFSFLDSGAFAFGARNQARGAVRSQSRLVVINESEPHAFREGLP